MPVYLPQTAVFLRSKLREVREQETPEAGRLCADTLRSFRAELRAAILPERTPGPIILTGHQPVFYHPGILAKDYLADSLARGVQGVALNLVVDTDEAEIAFDYPVPTARRPKGRLASKRRFLLGPAGGILRELPLPPSVRDAFVSDLHAYLPQLPELFPKTRAAEIARWIETICQATARAESIMHPAIVLREAFERHEGLRIKTVFASDLTRSNAFSYFVDFIVKNAAEFRQLYNQALQQYRGDHGIRNPAQPLPDLDSDELPFWVQAGENRIAYRSGMDVSALFPRAVTLTLFCRLFLCDLFIHGRGGARYDVITDRLLESFFGCPGAPFTVASATLAIKPLPDYPVDGRSLEEINRDQRFLEFDPARFLAVDDPVRLRRDELTRSRSEPGADLRSIHHELLAIRHQAAAKLSDLPDRLRGERELAELVAQNQGVFSDRTLPFFFYDLTPIREAVAEYAAGT